jgi:hypothetical protein
LALVAVLGDDDDDELEPQPTTAVAPAIAAAIATNRAAARRTLAARSRIRQPVSSGM